MNPMRQNAITYSSKSEYQRKQNYHRRDSIKYDESLSMAVDTAITVFMKKIRRTTIERENNAEQKK